MMSISKLGYLAILFTVVLGVALVACGVEPEPATSPAAAPTAVPEPIATTMSAPTSTPIPTATPEPTPAPTATPQPTATPVPTPTVIPYPAVSGIVDVSNRGWSREVETTDGVVRLDEPPQRILSYSLGHDEILLALVDKSRFAAVGPFTGDPAYSNVAEQAEGLPTFEKGVENVLATRPDLVIVSKFTDADIVGLIQEAGVPVARPALESSAEGNIPTILLMGYMLGVEERALELVAEIEGPAGARDRARPATGRPRASRRNFDDPLFGRIVRGGRGYHRGRHTGDRRGSERGGQRRDSRSPDDQHRVRSVYEPGRNSDNPAGGVRG